MSLSYVVDGETELDSELFNPIIDRVNGDAGPLANMRAGVENVLDHGASWNETDNIPAINAALQSLKSTYGGGEVVVPTHKVFPIQPSLTNRIEIPSNCRINLGDARLKVADDNPAYDGIFTAEGGPSAAVENIAIIGGEIDQNPANHALADVVNNGAFALLLYNATDVVFEQVNVITGGVNTVVVNGVNCARVRVNDNTFTFIQGASSTPDYDNTAVYVAAIDFHINNNRFYSQHSESARACWEFHGSLATAQGNHSWNYWTLCNITNRTDGSGTPLDTDLADVSCNLAYGARQGITIWPQTGAVYGKIGITNNQIHLAQLTGNWKNFWGISFFTSEAINGDVDGLDISHNLIAFEEGDQRTVDADSVALDYSNSAGIATAQHSVLRNAQITHNTILNAPLYGMKIGNILFAGAEHENVLIEGNLQVDCGSDRAMHRDTRCPFIFFGKFTNTRVRNNPVVVTDADGTFDDQKWLYVHSAATSGGGNVFESNPVLVNGGHTLAETTKEAVFPMRRSVAATTLGTVTRKQEVFDEYGASLGFIPIYDAIT